MTTEKEEKRRQDDKTMRGIMITLVTALLIQAIGWIYSVGVMSNQVATNTKNIDKLLLLDTRLVRIETILEGIDKSNKSMVILLNNVYTEQNKRTYEIIESKEHRTNDKIHKH